MSSWIIEDGKCVSKWMPSSLCGDGCHYDYSGSIVWAWTTIFEIFYEHVASGDVMSLAIIFVRRLCAVWAYNKLHVI
jgi:hypothetical protein